MKWTKKDVVGYLIGVPLLIVVSVGIARSFNGGSQSGTQRASTTEGTILLSESGSGTGVFSLDVPEYCFAQRLDYVANRREAGQPATIKFVVMDGADEVRVTGPADILVDDTRGVGLWSLEDDRRYTLTVYGDHTEWVFLLKCD